MTCIFCGARNIAGETRCRKCGRKPDDTLNGEFTLATANVALAAKLQARQFPVEPPSPAIRGVQRPLFPEEAIVVPIAPPAATHSNAMRKKPPTRRRPVPEGQQKLDFFPAETPKPRTLSTTVEAVVSCDSPVAPLLLRVVAGCFDFALAFIAFGIFFALFLVVNPAVTWNRLTFEVLAAALLLLVFTYGFLWALLGLDTAGMRWTGLRLTTFEGFPLERRQRMLRFVGGCLSLCTLVGRLWSLADEEGLSWQDHISRTFPTPLRNHEEVFRRG